MKLKGKHTMVFGLKGSGKSNWLQYVLHRPVYAAHLCFDVCQEHDVLRQYLPTHRRGEAVIEEFDQVLQRMVLNADPEGRPEIIAGEEISRYAPNNGAVSESLLELIDLNRHYGVGFIGVARRPAQVNTDLVELADNLVVFKLTGKNDYRRLEQEVEGLGDAVRDLGPYEWVHVDGSRNYRVMRPVPEMDTTGSL